VWQIEVEGDPPTWNHSYRIGYIRGRPGIVKLQSVSDWQAYVSLMVRVARPSDWQPGRRVRVVIDWRTSRARDCDAGLKALLDAVATGLGVNDRIFLACIRSNEVDRARPRTLITIANEEDCDCHLQHGQQALPQPA
jgi:Holliday junction resolvase RusA-like endonuclease